MGQDMQLAAGNKHANASAFPSVSLKRNHLGVQVREAKSALRQLLSVCVA
jgi:hypothetical protein